MFNRSEYSREALCCENWNEPVQILPSHNSNGMDGGVNRDPYYPSLKGDCQYRNRTGVPSGLPSLRDLMRMSLRGDSNTETSFSNNRPFDDVKLEYSNGSADQFDTCFQEHQHNKNECSCNYNALTNPAISINMEKKLASPKKWLLNKYRQSNSSSSSDSSAESSPKEYTEEEQCQIENECRKPHNHHKRERAQSNNSSQQDEEGLRRTKRRKTESPSSANSSSTEYPTVLGSPNSPIENSPSEESRVVENQNPQPQEPTNIQPEVEPYPHYYGMQQQMMSYHHQQYNNNQMWNSMQRYQNEQMYYQNQQQQSWPAYNQNMYQQQQAQQQQRIEKVMNQAQQQLQQAQQQESEASKKRKRSSSVTEEQISGKLLENTSKGTTCHQCKQKTNDKKSCCCMCSAKGGSLIRGSFCASCLSNRYGENLDEVLKNPQWVCPICRSECNCSSCRRKLQKTPVSVTTREALKKGFQNVKAYLVSIGSL